MEEIQYELELPEELYEQLCDLAEQNGITVEEQISRCCQAVIDKFVGAGSPGLH